MDCGNGHPGFSGMGDHFPHYLRYSGDSCFYRSCWITTILGSGIQSVGRSQFGLVEKTSWFSFHMARHVLHRGIFLPTSSLLEQPDSGAVEQQGVDPAMTGMPDGMKWRIYASSEVHHVVNRAAAVLGIGRRSVVPIPVNSRRELDLGCT